MYLVLGLRALGHRAVLVAHPEGELLRRLSEGMDLIPLAPERDIDLSAAWSLSRVIRQLAPDVVHAHDGAGVAMASMALSISAPTPKPALVASRRIDARIGHSSFARWTEGEIDCFIANCNAIRDRLVADGAAPHKTAVVHEGVDLERIARLPAANVHAAFYLPTRAPIVGNVASLIAQKGHHHLIDAAAEVVRQVPDTRLVIAGDGDRRDALEEQIRHTHLERHVFLAGFRADALELTKGFDVLAVSSVSEGMCSSLLDAMAAGKPAVATAVGGIPETIDDGVTGFLVPPRDHHAMAERLITLLEDEVLRGRMGAAALERARRCFAVDVMVNATLGVYHQLFNQ
jgi:glycosyltransferase involved in cell wall biosynthesis